jgi:uncharacterized membrane protein
VTRCEPTENMGYLIAGLVIFLGVHSVSIVNHRWRDRLVERLGPGPWRALYSLAAIVGLALIAYGYGRARQAPIILYVPPLWLRDTVPMLMVFVFPLLFAAYFPGLIRAVLKHPMLVAVKLWATLHLLANGSLADVLLFGSVLAWAVVDRISLKRRPPRPVPSAPAWKWNDAIAIGLGLAVFVAFVAGLHEWVTGMPIVFGRR